jgi:serine/tyrosine/threonine adenylyltransferase
MNTILQDGEYRPDPAILTIADFIADPVSAAEFPEAKLRFRNDRWAATVGLSTLPDTQWCEHFGRFSPLPGNLERPLALRYHGHQFRVYNPDIGDGRGFLFAQMRDASGRLMDLGTKGSGQTPWSRFGDGRLTLKGAVREILATEMLEALGVETSKTFSVIETGEALHRGDEPSPTRSAVLVRLNHSHMRIGNFQRLKRLVAYALKHYFGEEDGDDAPLRLLRHTVARTAAMAASFMAAGFVHGVLNSDNINITGESFDYGPWRFAPTFDAGFTAAYFDHANLYSFGRQAEAIHWDVAQLAIAFSALATEDDLIDALGGFSSAYRDALVPAMLRRLGVRSKSMNPDIALVQATEHALVESQCSIDEFFFDWRGGRCRQEQNYENACFSPLKAEIASYEPIQSLSHPYWAQANPCSMLIEEVEAIWAPIAEQDDWTLLHDKVANIRAMGEALLSK